MYYYGLDDDEAGVEFLEEPIVRPPTPLIKRPFRELIKDTSRPVFVFGAVPPPERLGEDIAIKSCEALARTFLDIKPDAVIVYDIQVCFSAGFVLFLLVLITFCKPSCFS